MNFKSIKIDDKDVMHDILIKNPYGICDFSFANIFIWQEIYKTKFVIHKGFLILKSEFVEGEPSFLMPVGFGCLEEVIKDLICYTKEIQCEFKMVSLTSKMVDELSVFMPENFVISNEDEIADYIYLSEKLISLSGKKLHGKRNHINKFMQQYSGRYEYKNVTADMILECRQTNKKWCEQTDCRNSDSDYCAVKKALENFTALDLKGGSIYIDGEMVAFTLAQANNFETFDIIIEKGLTNIEGIYQMINKEFAARNCADYLYINREEDMGSPGLKKAKLSYYPHLLLEKSMGVLK